MIPLLFSKLSYNVSSSEFVPVVLSNGLWKRDGIGSEAFKRSEVHMRGLREKRPDVTIGHRTQPKSYK